VVVRVSFSVALTPSEIVPPGRKCRDCFLLENDKPKKGSNAMLKKVEMNIHIFYPPFNARINEYVNGIGGFVFILCDRQTNSGTCFQVLF